MGVTIRMKGKADPATAQKKYSVHGPLTVGNYTADFCRDGRPVQSSVSSCGRICITMAEECIPGASMNLATLSKLRRVNQLSI